jgi:Nif-specific regulatory protein
MPESARFEMVELIREHHGRRVWKVEDRRRPGRLLALKELPADNAGALDADFGRWRFDHPNLVALEEWRADASGGPPIVVMEWIDGLSLADAVSREGPTLLLEVAAQSLLGLSFLHGQKLMQHSLTPGNVLVRREVEPRRRTVLLDYAPALRAAVPPDSPVRLSYVAPELLDGGRPTARSDLYSLGILLFEAIHGRGPFRQAAADSSKLREAVRAGRRSRPPVPAGYPEGLAAWIESLLSPDPAMRPRDARAALAALNESCGTAFPATLPDDPAVRAVAGATTPRAGRPDPLETLSIDRRLVALYDMIRTLNSEDDPQLLLRSILDMALEVVQAERGMILLRATSSGAFEVCLARNLERETLDDAGEFSRHVVEQAGAGKSVLALDAQDDERFRHLKSVSLHGIHSLMCVPLRSRGEIIGSVYLDSRRVERMFNRDHLRFLEAFADHAALALENAQARAHLANENLRLQAQAEERARFGNLVGRAPGMQQVFSMIERVADSDLPVLIQGESGTGKELVARAIHFNGPRRKRPFISENCAAIPDSLLQTELFGHVRGAFTGASRDRSGLFEQAHGGTLMLDEVGDMSPTMQAQLLRVLQEGEVRRVGGDRPIQVDVRVLAATHRDLQAEVTAGRFREDLLYRLQVLGIQIPALRERADDVALLVGHFLRRIAGQRGREAPRIDAEVMQLLAAYAWPGNVRQLENVVQRLSLLAGDAPITRRLLEEDTGLRQLLGTAAPKPESAMSLEVSEREQIVRALRATQGNRSRAARILGISRATIYRKLKEYGL